MTTDMLHRTAEFLPADPDRLTAMAGYFELFAGWKPSRPLSPTLFVRVRDLLPATEPAPVWDLPHVEVTVPGDHFTVLEEHARTTAPAVHHWPAGPDRRTPGAAHRSEVPDGPPTPEEAGSARRGTAPRGGDGHR